MGSRPAGVSSASRKAADKKFDKVLERFAGEKVRLELREVFETEGNAGHSVSPDG